MRLTSLALKRYGPFADAALEFDPAPGRINLVLAPNGAGKSVLRAAFGELLFGIGAQTPMGFRFGYPGMQLSATGIAADGTPFAFTRRKGKNNTLTGANDAPLDAAWLDRLLGRADRELLGQLFALDTERLRQGGRDLLNSGGALADALLAAAGGLREASALRQSLENERDRLAPVRKTAQRPFYQALERWSESRRQLRQAVVRPQQWAAREDALREAEALRDASNAAAAAAGERLRRLERIRRVRPLLARHAAALDWLLAHPDAPVLPAALAAKLPEARAAVAQAAHTLETAREFVARLDAEIAAIVPDTALLARAADIAGLVEAAGLAAQARAGLPEAEAAARGARERIAAQLDALGRPDADPAGLVPPPALLAQLRRLVAEHGAQAAALAAFPRRLAEQEARLREAEAALALLPPPGDTARLVELVAEIRREGDPVRALAAAQRGVDEAAARLGAALARLPAPLRDAAALAALAPPDPAALERLAAARDAAEALAERRDAAVRELDAALAAIGAEQAALDAQGVPPSREALAAARARRDAGWHLIFRQLSGDAPEAAARAFAGAQPLPLAFAEAMAAADRIADARLADAERATQAERLVRVAAARHAELAAARDAAAEARQAAAVARSAWGAAVGPLGLDAAAGLPEAQRVLAAREAGLAAAQELAAARAGLAELRAQQDGAAGRLQRAMGLAALAELPAALDAAEDRLGQHRAAEGERQARQAAAEAARQARRATEQDRAEAEARLASWRSEWETALLQLGHAPEAAPDALEAVLESHEMLGEALRDAAARNAQCAAWRDQLARFGAEYAALCEALGLAPEADAAAGVRALDRQQRAEAARAENRAALLKRHDGEAETLRRHAAVLAQAEAGLRAVIAASGATTAEAAEARIALAAERARQEAQRAELAAQLLEAGDGLSIEALREDVAAQPAELLEAALEEATAAQRGHAEQAQAHVATATALTLELRQLAGDDMALRAAAGEAAAAGLIGQALDDALLMQVAAGLLDAALGAVQQGSDDALLHRIGSAFAALTGSDYRSVASQEDERGTARLVVRPRDFPEEEFAVDQLSEGTRDQLFLALRLVAIEDHAAGGTVLPFLGDDILQSFDDTRAAAAFRALLGLSETAQVILLSHHDHVAEVARAALPSGALRVQRLPEASLPEAVSPVRPEAVTPAGE